MSLFLKSKTPCTVRTMNERVKHITKRVFWIILGFSLAALSIAAVDLKKSMYLTGLDIDILLLDGGNNLVTAEDIAGEITDHFGPVADIPVAELDASWIEEILLENPFMKQVDVYADAHQVLHVRVAQREPMMRIMDPSGGDYYIDREGVRIPVSKHYTVRVPVANGFVPEMEESRITGESDPVLSSLYQIAKTIHEDAFLKPLVDQVYLDEHQEVIMVPKIGVKKIIIGDDTDLKDKVDRIKIFYREAISGFAWGKYKQMDLRYAGQVVCK